MLEYNRIDISEGIDIKKCEETSRECNLTKNITTFNNNNYIPIERNHYICIPVIDIDSVLKIDKRAYPQTYLEHCKYKLKKRKIVNYIDDEIIDEDSDSDIDDAIDSHLNFSVPDSYVEI